MGTNATKILNEDHTVKSHIGLHGSQQGKVPINEGRAALNSPVKAVLHVNHGS